MGVIMLRLRLLPLIFLGLCGIARADGFFERLRKESAIERKMVLAEVRGELHLVKRPPPPDWRPRSWKKSSLEVQDGVPILRLEGTPEEMAEQHAHLLGEKARTLSESYLPAF